MIFLAGGPRLSAIEKVVGWPPCLLPLGPGTTVLESWNREVDRGVEASKVWHSVRKLVVFSSVPCVRGSSLPSGLEVVVEPRAHRGTAGVLRDQFDSGLAGDAVLVVETTASPKVDLASMFKHWSARAGKADGCVLGESHLGRYCGVALLSSAVVGLIPPVGFYDLKEQLLPKIRQVGWMLEGVVIAARARRIRTFREWLSVLGDVHSVGRSGFVLQSDPNWGSLVAASAVVRGAKILSSVVMDNAVVEVGAVVARSVIGPGMRVPAGVRVVDSILGDPTVGREALVRRSEGVSA